MNNNLNGYKATSFGSKRYLVILADRQRGRFFIIYLGTFEDQGEEIIDEDVPQKIKVEHTRPGRVQSHIRNHLLHHFKHVGTEAMRYVIKKQIGQLDGVFIGGHQEFLHQIKKALPAKLKNKAKGEFVMDINVPVGDLSKKITDKFNL